MRSNTQIGLKGLSLSVSFTFDIPLQHISKIAEIKKSILFEDVSFNVKVNLCTVHYTMRTSMQYWRSMEHEKIQKTVAQTRQKLLSKLSFCKADILSIKESVSMSFCSNTFNPA